MIPTVGEEVRKWQATGALQRRASGWWFRPENRSPGAPEALERSDLGVVWECFWEPRAIEDARVALASALAQPIAAPVDAALQELRAAGIASDSEWSFSLRQNRMVECQSGGTLLWLNRGQLPPQLLRALLRVSGALEPRPHFEAAVAELKARGLLVPAVGEISLDGILRRPLCSFFGWSRGTPIDRYYLQAFVAEIRDQVVGVTVEIGGRSRNRDAYGFDRCSEFIAVDLEAGAWVDRVGDVNSADMLPPDSIDSLVAFNVLEHLSDPKRVCVNFHRWLRPGGKAFLMVPVSQRIHQCPQDYWRILPQGMEALCAAFSALRPRCYGNLPTTVGALYGMAAEELGPGVLDPVDPEFPIAVCVVATK